MNSKEEQKLSKLMNSSGFPFQLAIENEINKTSSAHGWNIYSREYPWKNPITGTEGYRIKFQTSDSQASIFHQFLSKAMELWISKGGDLLFCGAGKIFFFGFR